MLAHHDQRNTNTEAERSRAGWDDFRAKIDSARVPLVVGQLSATIVRRSRSEPSHASPAPDLSEGEGAGNDFIERSPPGRSSMCDR